MDINDEELFQVSTSSDGIYIYIKKDIQLRVFNFFGVYDERLVVEIPEYFIGNLDLAASSLQFNLTAQTASGGIRTNFATQKNERGNQAIANIGDNPTVSITAKASSGGIRIEN